MAKPVPPTRRLPVPSAHALPVAQTLLVRYAKRGKMRFASHRDVARAFERGVQRAGLPIAYSAGFSPHPKLSYVGGAPTGVASEAEYLRIGLVSPVPADQVRDQLDAVLPQGIDVVNVTDEALADPEASLWQVILPDVTPRKAQAAVAEFLAMAEAPVERLTDKGVRRLDARAAVAALRVVGGNEPEYEDRAILRMVVLHQSPVVRPEDVLTAMGLTSTRAFGSVLPAPPLTTRLAQGSLAELKL